MPPQHSLTHSTESTNLADLLERILDKGVVVAGDISIKLVEVELLTIQLRLVICSVDKARELGLDWWNHDQRSSRQIGEQQAMFAAMDQRLGPDRAGAERRRGRRGRREGTGLMKKDDETGRAGFAKIARGLSDLFNLLVRIGRGYAIASRPA